MENAEPGSVTRESGRMTTSTSSPTVIQCSTPADFVASIPLLLGYIPTQSIVVTLCERGRAQCAVRLDLPARDVPLESTHIDRAVTDIVSRFSRTTSIAIVIYTEDTFARSPDTPHAMLAMWLERAVELRGIAVSEMACVARDGWAQYRASMTGAPRPLSEIVELQDSWIAMLPTHSDLRTLNSLGTLPDADEETRERIRASVEAHPPVDIGAISPADFSYLVTRCSEAFLRPTEQPDVDVAASLIRMTENMQTWLIPVMLISADTEAELAVLSDETAHAFLALLQNPALTPPSGGIPIAQRLLMFSSEKLGQGRLRHIINTLITLAAHTPLPHRPGILCLAAWAWWMGGMTTPASALLSEARALAPDHPAVRTVTGLIEAGTPLWIFAHAGGQPAHGEPRS